MLAALFFCGVHLPRFALSIMRCQPALRLFSLRFVDTSFAPVRASLQILFSPINPFSMSSFASASPWANVETSNSCIVTGACLSSSTIVPPHLITLSALASTFGEIVRPICLAAFSQAYLLGSFQIDDELKLCRLLYGRVSGCQS